jgi:hypothetical protein
MSSGKPLTWSACSCVTTRAWTSFRSIAVGEQALHDVAAAVDQQHVAGTASSASIVVVRVGVAEGAAPVPRRWSFAIVPSRSPVCTRHSAA